VITRADPEEELFDNQGIQKSNAVVAPKRSQIYSQTTDYQKAGENAKGVEKQP
jgi:hypothetical protein